MTSQEMRKRATPFSEAERLALTEAIRDRYGILFGALGPEVTFKAKTVAWKEVLEAVNKVSGNLRTMQQLKEKYKNLKKEAISKAAHNTKEFKKTGGGAAEVFELDASSQAILDTMPKASIHGIEDGIDTSIQKGKHQRITKLNLLSLHELWSD